MLLFYGLVMPFLIHYTLQKMASPASSKIMAIVNQASEINKQKFVWKIHSLKKLVPAMVNMSRLKASSLMREFLTIHLIHREDLQTLIQFGQLRFFQQM